MNEPWTVIVLFVVATLLVNFASWRYGMYDKSYHNPYLPPGVIIGLVWPILFGLMGYAYYLVSREKTDNIALIAILVFAGWCLLYPFLVDRNERRSKLVNYISLLIGFAVGILVFNESELAFYFFLPTLVWIGYVNLTEFI